VIENASKYTVQNRLFDDMVYNEINTFEILKAVHSEKDRKLLVDACEDLGRGPFGGEA
jgi:hypothetical protein